MITKVLSMFFLFVVTDCRADVLIAAIPVTQSISLGFQEQVSLSVSGLGNGTALGTYDISIGFDPALFSYSTITFGESLDVLGMGDIQDVVSNGSSVELFELSLDSAADLTALQLSSFRLATITLNTLAIGRNSLIIPTIIAVGDQNGVSIPTSVQNGVVNVIANGPVSPVPEPPAMIMVVSGILFLALANQFEYRSSTACGCEQDKH